MTLGFAQLVNGHVYDFSTIVAVINTPVPVAITRFTAIKWNYKLTPGELRGNSAHKLGRTRGTFSADGAITLYEEEWNVMRAALALAPLPVGGGYLEKAFLLTVSVGMLPSVPTTTVLGGCRVTEVSRAYSHGSDALMVDLTLDIMKVLEGGQSPVRDRSGIV